MRWFDPVVPSDGADVLLACSWTARPSGTHRLVPDGCIDLLWISTGQLVLCGPETTAWTFALPPDTLAAGVRFRPGVAPAVLGFDASQLLNRRVGIRSMVGAETHARLVGRLGSTDDLDEQRLRLEEAMVDRASGCTLDTSIGNAIVERIVRHRRVTAEAIAADVGLTVRQLHRRCLISFGYGAKTLSRLVRFQRFLAVVETDASATLSSAAADAGYSDHAHLARDCRAITGLTPRAFLDDYVATFPDMSDPFKTSSPLIARLGE